MTVRQAAGLDPMHLPIRLHGCHRDGNMVTDIDPASPEAQRPILSVEPLPVPDSWVRETFDDMRELIHKAFYHDDWFK